MSDEKQERRINVEDLPREEQELTDEEAKDVKGGIGLLLPAVQAAREAGRSSSSSTSTTPTKPISGDANGDGSV